MKPTNFSLAFVLMIPVLAVFATLTSCAHSGKKATLADIDISSQKDAKASVVVKTKSEAEIKQAYYDYIRNAAKVDKSRQAAINRIAAMELNLTNKLLATSQTGDNEEIADRVYLESLNKAAELLATSLNDFPDAENNDKTLYQLARTLDQLGRGDEALIYLRQLADNYPESEFYAEAQFRLGEHAFVAGNYLTAEDAYTEVILTPTNDRFYEKSLFKRGWTRYKQELYNESVDDYLQALTYHRFDDIEQLNKSEKEQFDEYFRAIGLVFSHLRGADSLRDYFANKPDFKYLFHTYSVVADIYTKQQRYSDAVETMKQFIAEHSQSTQLPLAQLKIVRTWQEGNFTDKLHDEVEILYSRFNPDADYWQNSSANDTRNQIQESLREYVVQLASFHHNQYQKKPTTSQFNQAYTWYKRYLEHFTSFAQKDRIYAQFGDLLAAGNRLHDALRYYELAAFDGDLVLDKKSALATVTLSNELYLASKGEEKAQLLNKHINYVTRYVSLYPDDSNVSALIANAAELSYRDGQYEAAIDIASITVQQSTPQQAFAIGNIKARAYLDSGDFNAAEISFADLLSLPVLSSTQRKQITDSAALTIYRQGELSKTVDIDQAMRDFSRISESYPESAIAANGLYDAATLAVNTKRWPEAIFYLERFQSLYPTHKFEKETARQLSVAYLNANQTDKAAQQLEALAKVDQSKDVQMTALWQAAKLYDDRGDKAGAIRSYREYAHNFPQPYPQNIEAMYRLTELYQSTNEQQKRFFWQNKIRTSDARASNSQKTERTNFIAAQTVLALALQKREAFSGVQLKEPLAKNLKAKKAFMQDAIKLFGQASAYSISDITTQSTFAIGDIYREFSKSLLASERPKNLKGEELEQYNILLEDQAFPFEEKAIEFYETNLSRVKDGTYNEWIANSHKQLVQLFPVRFNRTTKVEAVYDN